MEIVFVTQQSFFYTFTKYPHQKKSETLKNGLIHRVIHIIHIKNTEKRWIFYNQFTNGRFVHDL